MIRKLRSVSKFMTSDTGQQIIAIDTLPSVSRSESNQAMNVVEIMQKIR